MHAHFTEAVSFSIDCKDQSEVDYYWDSLVDGGEESMCGWLKDKFGLSWQIVPTRLYELVSDPDPVRARAATEAMFSDAQDRDRRHRGRRRRRVGLAAHRWLRCEERQRRASKTPSA